MSTLFAPPELLSAFSYAVDGRDPDLPKGTHLRVFAGMGANFPLAPFVVFKVRASASEPHGLNVSDANGKLAADLNLSALGSAELIPLLGNTDVERVVRVEFVPSAAGGIAGARLFSQAGGVVAERHTDPFLFSAPIMPRFSLWGTAAGVDVRTRSVQVENIVSRESPVEEALLIGLPFTGMHAWYLGVLDRDRALRRVANGAPLRLNVMDRPDGPFDALGRDAEVARVEAMLAAAKLGGDLETLALNMVDDRSAPPWAQVEKQQMQPGGGATKQFAAVPRLSNLQMAALDPGVARFLGFADCIPDLPDLQGQGRWDTLAVAGLFAVDPRFFDSLPQFLPPDPNEAVLIEMIARALSRAAGEELSGQLDSLIARVKATGLMVRAMLTVTAPTPPWLPPALNQPAVVEHRWQTAVDDTPSALYRATFAFDNPPLASMAAVAAEIGGAWTARHGIVDVGALDPSTRAQPRLFGHEQQALERSRFLRLKRSSSTSAGLLSDQDLPDGDAIPYRVHASDLFGRFGTEVDFAVSPPPRPAPPVPVLRFHLERATVDPASTAPASPGTLKLVFAVPQAAPAARFSDADQPRLASAVVVPAIGDMAAGTKVIKRANLTLEEQTLAVDVSVSGFFDATFVLPMLLPQETRSLTLSVTFTDTDDVDSLAAKQTVKVTDRRPPQTVPTGIGLFWTSAPGPSPEVELTLAWPAAANSLHRVYATDQQGLALSAAELAEPVLGAFPSRGRVAEVGCNKVLGGAAIAKSGFHLLTDPAIEAGADGRAVLQTSLPRSLETVQFLRMVPVSQEGAEAPFDNCGIVPVAVPESRRPAMPRLDGSVDPDTGVATLTVVADAFDEVSLHRDEPGLFDGGGIGASPPSFRIRRAVGAVIDPVYARSIAAGSLVRDAAAAPAVRFAGSAIDANKGGGLDAFVQYIYWADVQLPPERRLPAGVLPLDPPGGVTAVDPANAADYARPPSLPSAPRVLMRVPAGPLAAPAADSVTLTRSAPDVEGGVPLTITISDPPAAHPKAVDKYRLAIWTQWPGTPIAVVTSADGVALDGEWPYFPGGEVSIVVPAPPPSIDAKGPMALRLAFVDPLGRLGTLSGVITVPP